MTEHHELGPRVLVLGATGSIGAAVVNHLAKCDAKVGGVSRRPRPEGLRQNVAHFQADAHDPLELSVVSASFAPTSVLDLTSFTTSQVETVLSSIPGSVERYSLVSSATVYARSPVILKGSNVIVDGWSYPLNKLDCEKYALARQGSSINTLVRPYIVFDEGRQPFGVWEYEAVYWRVRHGLPIILPEGLLVSRTTITPASAVGVAIAEWLLEQDTRLGELLLPVADVSVTWGQVFGWLAEAADQTLSVIEVSPDFFRLRFPKLAGKLEDRMAERRFGSGIAITESEIRQQFIRCCRIAYEMETLPADFPAQGAMDRIALRANRRLLVSVLRSWLGLPIGGKVKYLVGASPLLSRSLRWARRVVGAQPTDPYGVRQ